jgi:hypothetical protein
MTRAATIRSCREFRLSLLAKKLGIVIALSVISEYARSRGAMKRQLTQAPTVRPMAIQALMRPAV